MEEIDEKRFISRTGRLHLDGLESAQVRCDIEFPLRDEGELNVTLYWSSKRHLARTGFGSFEFDTKVDIKGDWAHERVRLIDLHIYETSFTHLNPDSGECTAKASAYAFEHCHFRGNGEATTKTHLSLLLTPNRMLEPFRIIEQSYKGTIKQEPGKAISVKVPILGKIQFDFHYDWEDSKDHRVRQSRRYLVANLRSKFPVHDSEGLMREVVTPIEDLLLLTGFASRTPMRCAGWLAGSSLGHVEYYKRDVALPPGKQRHRTITNGGLLELSDFEAFLNHTIVRFQNSSLKREIRHAFYALENCVEQTIEQKFVSLFSAFEGLVDGLIGDHAKQRFAKEKGLRDTTRDRILHALAEWVDGGEISEGIRNQFAKQVKGVQSISQSERYKLLGQVVAFNPEDLWPLIGQGETMSLYRIRNWIVHGSSMDDRHFPALVIADHHIEWHLERLICAILDWPLEKTDLSPNALRSYWLPDTVNWKGAAQDFHTKGD